MFGLLFFMGLITASAQKKLPVKIHQSTVHWEGYYVFHFGGHQGTIKLLDGYFLKSDDKLTGGDFVIDMKSLKSTDLESVDGRTNLDNHLKAADFFDVEKHPLAVLSILRIDYEKKTKVKVYANLTIKGIMKPIYFSADLNYEKKTFRAKFKIDRRKWKVNYTSAFRDGAISDAIGFDVLLQI